MNRETSLSRSLAMLAAALCWILSFLFAANLHADDQVHIAYISDSPGSSAPYWIAQDAGIYKKYGLDAQLIFINGSTRGIQSLMAGELQFAGAVGTSAINAGLAGGDVVIVDSLVNTLPGGNLEPSSEAVAGRVRSDYFVCFRNPFFRIGAPLVCAEALGNGARVNRRNQKELEQSRTISMAKQNHKGGGGIII